MDTIGVSLESSELDWLDFEADVYAFPIVYRDPETPSEWSFLAEIAGFIAGQPRKARQRAKYAIAHKGLTVSNVI